MANKFQRSVSIIGVGCTPFGDVLETPELQGMTERELASWAAIDAMRDAGISSKDVDAFYIGHCLDEQVSGSINTAAAVADWIGMRNKPGLHQEAACATGGTGLWLACQAVASGCTASSCPSVSRYCEARSSTASHPSCANLSRPRTTGP